MDLHLETISLQFEDNAPALKAYILGVFYISSSGLKNIYFNYGCSY